MGFYKSAQAILRPLARVLFRLRGENGGGLPETGPVVLVCNHKANLDPVFMGIIIDRALYFMAKEELFHVPVLAPLIRFLGAFPVRRGVGDTAAMAYAQRLLSEGKVVAMFPEGTRQRNGDVPMRFKAGAARLAFEKKCPVVPVAMLRTGKWGIFRRKTVRVGRPIPFEELGFQTGSPEELRRVSAMLRAQVVALMGLPAGS